MTEPLEAVTIADEVTPEHPSPLEQEAAKGEDFSLKSFRKAQEKAEKADLEAPALEVIPEPEVKDIGAEPAKAEPVRDEQGRFVKPDAAKAEPAASDDDDESQPPKTVSQFQKRLDKLRWKQGEAERAATAERDRALQLERELAALKAPKPEPAAVPAPKPAEKFPSYEDWLKTHDGATYEDYLDARADDTLERKLTAERQRLEADSRSRAAANALQHINTLGAQTHADFEAVVQAAFDAGIRWAPHVTQFVLSHTESAEEAVALTYALAQDHALATRVNRLPPGRAFYELGKLTTSLPSGTPPASSGAGAAPAPGTRAPKPITPVGAGAAASPVTPESLVLGSEISLKKLRAVMERD